MPLPEARSREAGAFRERTRLIFGPKAWLAWGLILAAISLLSVGCDAATLFGGIYLPQGSGLNTYTTPTVSLETWPYSVQFDSYHRVTYSNLTEDSVFVGVSTLWMDVWASDPDTEGLVCTGARIESDEQDIGGWMELANSPWRAGTWGWMTMYVQESIDKGDTEGVWIDHKTADALDYTSILEPFFSGPTCYSAVAWITSFAWRDAIPGWQTWSPSGGNAPSDDATRWNSISISCPGPC